MGKSRKVRLNKSRKSIRKRLTRRKTLRSRKLRRPRTTWGGVGVDSGTQWEPQMDYYQDEDNRSRILKQNKIAATQERENTINAARGWLRETKRRNPLNWRNWLKKRTGQSQYDNDTFGYLYDEPKHNKKLTDIKTRIDYEKEHPAAPHSRARTFY